MEQTLMSTPTEGEEHSTELLKIFSQEAEQEMTAALEPAAEEEADNMDFVDLYEELEALERRVMVQSQHIQQAKLESRWRSIPARGTTGGSWRYEPTQEELTEANMSEEEAEQQLSDETAELEFAAGGKLMPQEKMKTTWGIKMIYPLIRKTCSREDCIRRANHWSSWTG
jgi:hypothetical protein